MKYIKKILLQIAVCLFIFHISANIAAQNSEDSPFGFHPALVNKAGYPNNGYTDAQYIGVRWHRPTIYAFWALVQPNLNDASLDFTIYDAQYGKTPLGINILANILPAPNNTSFPAYYLNNSYFPSDSAKYVRFVKNLVERYDGDGVGDMPGLVNPIKYWQVGNEPNILKADFARLQKTTYLAIKSADPTAHVLIGGVAGFPFNYIAMFDAVYNPLLSNLSGNYFDIFDFHWYGTADGEYRLKDTKTGQDVLTHIRSKLTAFGYLQNIPIWITEMGAYSGDPADNMMGNFPYQTENQQAADYVKRFIYPLSVEVRKIFPAFGLMEGFKNDNGYFDHTGLIYDGALSNDLGLGSKKTGYFSYKLMTQKLEGSDWNNISAIIDDTINNTYAYKFINNTSLKSTYIAWWDFFNDPNYYPGDSILITISDINTSNVIITEAVPIGTSGNTITDFNTAFKIDTINVSAGTTSIYLKEKPVYVEGFNLTNINIGEIKQSVTIYPNPATDFIYITSEYINKTTTVMIKNIIGKIVPTRIFKNGEKIKIDVRNLPSGIYFISIQNGQFFQTEKIIIEQ